MQERGYVSGKGTWHIYAREGLDWSWDTSSWFLSPPFVHYPTKFPRPFEVVFKSLRYLIGKSVTEVRNGTYLQKLMDDFEHLC